MIKKLSSLVKFLLSTFSFTSCAKIVRPTRSVIVRRDFSFSIWTFRKRWFSDSSCSIRLRKNFCSSSSHFWHWKKNIEKENIRSITSKFSWEERNLFFFRFFLLELRACWNDLGEIDSRFVIYPSSSSLFSTENKKKQQDLLEIEFFFFFFFVLRFNFSFKYEHHFQSATTTDFGK